MVLQAAAMARSWRGPSLVFAVVVFALGASGCSREPEDPVAALLAALEHAAEARDAEAVMERLTSDFTAGGMTRADTLVELKRTLAGYEEVALELGPIETQRDADTAQVRCVVEFSGRGRKLLGLEGLLPPEAAYRFDLELRRSGGRWLVHQARWEALGEAPPAR
jgi:hypothetical protein